MDICPSLIIANEIGRQYRSGDRPGGGKRGDWQSSGLMMPSNEISDVLLPTVEQKLLSPSDDAEYGDRGTASDAIGWLVVNGNRPPTVPVTVGGEDGTVSSNRRSVVMTGMSRVFGATATAADDDVDDIGILTWFDDCSTDCRCSNNGFGMSDVSPDISLSVAMDRPSRVLELPPTSMEIPPSWPEIPECVLKIQLSSSGIPPGSAEIPSSWLEMLEGALKILSGSLGIPPGSVEIPTSSLEIPEGAVEVPQYSPGLVDIPSVGPEIPDEAREIPLGSVGIVRPSFEVGIWSS